MKSIISCIISLIFIFGIGIISCFAADPKPNCNGTDSLCSPGFQVKVSDFGFGSRLIGTGNSAADTINNTIGTIIQQLMIVFGVVALLIMSIGAGYMVIYHGDDELLSRGKGIFTAGITSLVIALSSYYIVDLVRYILYSK